MLEQGQVPLGVEPVLPLLVQHDEQALLDREVLGCRASRARCGSPTAASCSSVSDAMHIADHRLAFAPDREHLVEGRPASRSQGMPSQPGASSHGRSSGCHGDGSPRIIRPTQAALAKLRCRRVWMNDHSSSTLRCSAASGNVRARSTCRPQPLQDGPRLAEAVAVVGSHLRPLGHPAVQLGLDQRRDVDAVDDDVLQLAVDLDVDQLDAAHPGAVQHGAADLHSGEVDARRSASLRYR